MDALEHYQRAEELLAIPYEDADPVAGTEVARATAHLLAAIAAQLAIRPAPVTSSTYAEHIMDKWFQHLST